MFKEFVLFEVVVCFLPATALWLFFSLSFILDFVNGGTNYSTYYFGFILVLIGGGIGLTGIVKLLHRYLYPKDNNANPKTIILFTTIGIISLMPGLALLFQFLIWPVFAVVHLVYLERDFLWKNS